MLHYDPLSKQHYVGENRFDTIELLVADGLIHFYVETRGADVLQKIANANTYQSTPFYKVSAHGEKRTTSGFSRPSLASPVCPRRFVPYHVRRLNLSTTEDF